MQKKRLQKSRLHYTVFIVLGLSFCFLQTRNAMIDSWYYAGCVKYGRELLNSHHLIYNIFGYYWFSLVNWIKPGTEAIVALNVMNAIAATASLFALYFCLKKLKHDNNTAFWLTFFCGTSFGFMRYATDAETYILPLLFSLISTRYFLAERNNKTLLVSGLFAAISILIHQLHLWWTLSMFVALLFKKPFKLRQAAIFALPLLLVPIGYYFAFHSLNNGSYTFVQFVTGEYSKGNAHIDFSIIALLLTVVNFVRTFIQVHGQIAVLFKQYLFVYLSLFGTYAIVIIVLMRRKAPHFRISTNAVKTIYPALFLTAFILHLVFAFLSSGNAEFMVVLPFLLILFLASAFHFEKYNALKFLTVFMLLWNLSFAIVPNALLDIRQVERQVTLMKQHPDAHFLWKNKPLVENVFAYRYELADTSSFIGYKTLDRVMLDTLLKKGNKIYTDLYNPGGEYSREWLLSGIGADKIIRQFTLLPIDSFQNLYGKNYIYLMEQKMD